MTAVNFNNFTNPVDEPQLQRIISSILKYKKEEFSADFWRDT
jgi:hypothetical protein